MRNRRFNIVAIRRAAGFTLVAATIIAAAVHFAHQDRRSAAPAVIIPWSPDPLARELAHCQTIGMAAADDAACGAAWAENRRRFFTYRLPAAASPTVAVPQTTPTENR
jgi:conjugative transfer region protein TrbK